MKTRIWLKWANFAAALLAGVGLTYLGANGAGPLPALGPTFNPGTGVWTVAAGAHLPTSETLQASSLNDPVQIMFDKNGTAYIHAKTNHDLFFAIGYLHAKFRLFQMDLMRRQGEGLLSQVVGPAALPSDKFEDQLGILRTAQQEWRQMSINSPARQALLAYSQGVNDVIAKDAATGRLPVLFKLLGYQPKLWTPVDSLVVQGIMTQTLDFSTGPLDYALMVKSLGYRRTMSWFPILPPDRQHPYDPGPYKYGGVAPIEGPEGVSVREAKAVATVIKHFRSLPKTALHHGSNSNNWAVNGPKSATGQAMMAGDPHLNQTLPSIWYQVSASAPGYHFSGVSIPGLPMILIGHNRHIAWSLTNVQNQATLFYAEKTSPKHPGAYFWNGAWRPMKVIHDVIPVKNAPSVRLNVDLTVQGPIMTQNGQTLAVDWMGALPSPDLASLLGIVKSHNFTQFRNALRNWHAPSQNFVYADNRGNIGLISAGYYPIVKHGDPWLPLSGTGRDDVIGTIPYRNVPQVYDPPSHMVFSANQREVGNQYPYYIGTTWNFFTNGYRADEIYQYLSTHNHMTMNNFAALQNSTRDYLAGLIVPKLLAALRGQPLTARQRRAQTLLVHWNGDMNANSAAASIWWTFWTTYLRDTFGPWWQAGHVPTALDSDLAIGPGQAPFDEDLEAWTLHDPTNPAFNLPSGAKRPAAEVMRGAFAQTVRSLSAKLGADPNQWLWGRVHFRAFPSLAQISSLGYPKHGAGGDQWTVDAADGGMVSTAGPSWRMIVDWGTGAEGVYPGGQSENPLSPWYKNQIPAWWNGKYYPLLTAAQVRQAPYHPTWTLKP
ncbi:MAG: penicillin acylase family protein [Bacilli bacterium]